jgi:nucleoside phosphorylase
VIAITFALPAESSYFLRLVGNKTRRDLNSVPIITGKIDNREIEVVHTGVGENICRRRIASFLQDRQFDYLISAGFAGALTDQLHVGDVLLARNFSTLDVRGAQAFHFENLHTAPNMIDSGEEREELAQTTGAAAVDMETKFIARACAEHALPLLSLRVISDTPAEALPAPPNVLFDVMKQRTNFAELAAFFLAHPNRVPRLIQFARRIAHSRKILANAIVDVLPLLPT